MRKTTKIVDKECTEKARKQRPDDCDDIYYGYEGLLA